MGGRLNLNGGTLNLDEGMLTLDGGCVPLQFKYWLYPTMASLNSEQANSQTNRVGNCICKTCNKVIQDSNIYTVCDACCESNHENFCKHLPEKLNSLVCPLKCKSNKERNNNCPSLLSGDNSNNCKTLVMLRR